MMDQQASVRRVAAVVLLTWWGIGQACAQTVRFATFNIWELTSQKLAEVDSEGHGTTPQLRKAAEIIQRARPDVLLINEIDFDPKQRRNAGLFAERYLKVSEGGQPPLDYPHVFFEPVNTGVPTGMDLNNDGKTDGPDDAFGFGRYDGQYGMALYSRFEIDREGMRSFQMFKWRDMPGPLMPDGQDAKPAWYSPEEAAAFRLSSKSHWDVPLRIGGEVIHVLASHPTPPVFDGPEDRNGRRNFDEIRLWADYIAGGERAAYLMDDRGRKGGLADGTMFVIMGDLNSDPQKGEKVSGKAAIEQLLSSPRVQDPRSRRTSRVSLPESGGASSAPTATSPLQPDAESVKTADFGRVDYVLPSVGLEIGPSGVFWPSAGDPLAPLVSKPDPASDHHLVFVDVQVRGSARPGPKQ